MGAGGEAGRVIRKPSTDKLEYGSIRLSNGLQALLISDPTADKASAALDVSIRVPPCSLRSLLHKA